MSIRFLKQLPTDSGDKNRFADQAINEIIEGEVSPLEAFAMLKHIEDIISDIKSNPIVQAALYTELDKYSKGETPTALGYSISRGERKNWDYSETGDYKLNELKESAKAIGDQLKEREKFLQSLKQKMVDAENGGFEVSPPKVTYTTYPILKEAKVILSKESDPLPF